MIEFISILKNEMNDYIDLCQSEGKSIVSIKSGIHNFDTYLNRIGYATKALSADVMGSWINQLHPLKKVTISWNVKVVRQFLYYLYTLGLNVFIPDVPAYRSDYVPYAFSDNEITRIFEKVDALSFKRKDGKKSIIQFSVYLRILYGCGLRSGEALKLRKSDVDLNRNILVIKNAKGKKDRIVPMSNSLAQLLKSYIRKLHDTDSDGFIFAGRNGFPRNSRWAYALFQKVLKQSGIIYARENHERAGPSPYSLRHAFIHRAYRKYAEATDHSFDDIIPFLSAYVGHENSNGTDHYFKYDNGLFSDAMIKWIALLTACCRSEYMDKTLMLPILENFLYTYLPKEKGRGPNTILSYAYVFQLLFEFCEQSYGIEPSGMLLEDFQIETIRDFLFWLETARQSGASTRNQRLSALKAFSAYLGKRYFAVSHSYRQSVGTAEVKKAVPARLTYFTIEEIKAIFNLPFKQTASEQRDRVMLSVLYASGARAQELCDLEVGDLIWSDDSEKGCRLTLHGKGGKVRIVRISPRCTELLRNHLENKNLKNMLSRDKHIFSSQTHEHMTPSCVSAVVNKYVNRARAINPHLFNEKKYSPHSFRHSVATHMLAAKISLPTIKNFLGHESIQSTLVYTRVTDAAIDTALIDYWKHAAELNSQIDSVIIPENIDLVSKAKQLKKELSE